MHIDEHAFIKMMSRLLLFLQYDTCLQPLGHLISVDRLVTSDPQSRDQKLGNSPCLCQTCTLEGISLDLVLSEQIYTKVYSTIVL